MSLLRGCGERALRWLVLEDLEVGTELAAEESELPHDGARVDAQVVEHPVVVRVVERSERVDVARSR